MSYKVISIPSCVPLSVITEAIHNYGYTQYIGNCVSLIDQFRDDEEAPVEWMKSTLMHDEDVIRIPSEVFFDYIDKKLVPKEAKLDNNAEYYYLKKGAGHPSGSAAKFMIYTDNSRGDDIHYFFSYEKGVNVADFVKVKIDNGYGAGSMMFEA